MPLFEIPAIQIVLVLVMLYLAVRISHVLCHFLNAPLVMGELLAGIILGPSILGTVSPDVTTYIFPTAGPVQAVFKQINSISVLLLLFAAGLEMNLSFVKSNLKQVLFTSFGSAVLPFAIGVIVLTLFPSLLSNASTNSVAFPIFFGIAMAISALPVIIRILGDLKLINTTVGSLTIASASVMDLAGWAAFTALLGYMGHQEHRFLPLPARLLILLVSISGAFSVLPKCLNPLSERLQTSAYATPMFIGLGLLACSLGAYFTEVMGVHNGFGALMAGALLGHLPLFPEKAKRVLLTVAKMLSPLFFIGLGGYLNFVANFDGTLLIVVLLISIPGKVIGSTLGCLTGGVKAMDSFMVGMLLNARGAMEIILAKQALEYGVIEAPLFVALALMAILTSLMSSYGTSYLMSLQKNGKGNPYASSVKPETRQIVTG